MVGGIGSLLFLTGDDGCQSAGNEARSCALTKQNAILHPQPRNTMKSKWLMSVLGSSLVWLPCKRDKTTKKNGNVGIHI